ncbi:putative deacetylase LmbE-like domain-containing protein [Gautieria morchelliformis]|nr:putative deacetylase LmbE-like domain-containing protein [Gautieria morchelliformis]
MRHTWRNISVIFIAWLLVSSYGGVYPSSSSFGGAERVLLLTAHPDDECMFFAPTILSLLQSSVALFSVCLSVGNADGLGDTRVLELRKSLRVLGIPDQRSLVVNHPLLQDNFTEAWDSEVIAEVVGPYIDRHNITVILTFDQVGVSQHPNHISLPGGVSHLLSSPGAPSVQAFALRTVPLFHKYLGPVAPFLTKLGLCLPWTSSTNEHTHIAGFGEYLSALRAMYQHQSQLVWFRWLYVLFSRYMWVNEWFEMDVTRAQ